MIVGLEQEQRSQLARGRVDEKFRLMQKGKFRSRSCELKFWSAVGQND